MTVVAVVALCVSAVGVLALSAHALWLDDHGHHRPGAVDPRRRIQLRPKTARCPRPAATGRGPTHRTHHDRDPWRDLDAPDATPNAHP